MHTEANMPGRLWIYPALATLSVLLFVGGPDANSHRVFKLFWDTGHFVYFAMGAVALLHTRLFHRKPWTWKTSSVLALSFVLGLSVEVVQLRIGRTFAWTDLANDMVGACIGLALVAGLRFRGRHALAVSLYVLALCLTLYELRPLASAVVDDYLERKDFPVLAGFETPFELSRWKTNSTKVSLDHAVVRSGSGAMKIDFLPAKYPGVTLIDFPSNWQHYKHLRFSLYNPGSQPLYVVCKIYDAQHQANGYEYNDRFNKQLSIKPGWNDIAVPLEEVMSSPRTRSMDMTHIQSLAFFMIDLRVPTLLFLDGLRLS